jgi:hypothetical protein
MPLLILLALRRPLGEIFLNPWSNRQSRASLEGNRDLEEQSLNAYEVGYTASVAKDRISLGAAFYINDSKGDYYWPQVSSYTSQDPPPGWPLPPFVLDLMIEANAFGPGMGLPSLYTSENLGRVRNEGLELSTDARPNRYVTVFANYSWQARPVPRGFDISALNLPPTNRFNAGMSLDYRRYFGNLSVGYVGSAYWNDMIPVYNGPTKAYSTVGTGAGIRWGRSEKYTAMPQFWIIPWIIRSHHDHPPSASSLERERSAKFTVIWVKTVVKSHSKIQRS